MNILTISDLHIHTTNPISRKDDVLKTQLKKLNFILNYAKQNDAIIVINGDMFHNPRSWYLMAQVAEIIKGHSIFAVFGQHDTYYYSLNTRQATNLGVLNKALLINILGPKPIRFNDEIHIYGASITEPIPEILDENKLNILSIHAPISDSALFSTHEFINAEDFISESKFDMIFCGDIHRKFIVEKNNKVILNSGPMLRIECTEYNFQHKPGFWFINTETKKIEYIEIPHDPAEEVLSRLHIVNSIEKKTTLNDFAATLHQKGMIKNEETDVKKKIIKYFDDNGIEEEIKELFSTLISKEK